MNTERIRTVIAEMTLDEKVALCGLDADYKTQAVERLKIPSVCLPRNDGPSLTALGCSFDRDLATDYGRGLGARALQNKQAVCGPVNAGVVRMPMAQGAERMLGEDPFAVGQMLSAVLSDCGLRGAVCGMLGGELPYCDRTIDARALSEVYLRPVRTAAKVLGGAVIPAGTINGEPVYRSRMFLSLLSGCLPASAVLYNELGAVTDKTAAIAAGGCLQPLPAPEQDSALYAAVKDGRLFERVLDLNLERLLGLIWDYNKQTKQALPQPNADETFERRLCEKSAVLLKNEVVLPLPRGTAVSVSGDITRAEAQRLAPVLAPEYGRSNASVRLVFLRLSGETYTAEQVAAVRRAATDDATVAVVLLAARPAPLPFASDAHAILYVPAVGDETLPVVADILTGRINPSGKLNVTWAHAPGDYPACRYKRVEGRGMFCYESVFLGHRYFSAFSRPVLYPFGHGLSYTGFTLSKLQSRVRDDCLSVDFTVKNTGIFAGETTVFVFASLPSETIFGLTGRLVAFTRVALERDESTAVHMEIPIAELAVFDASSGEWPVPNGKYTLSVGLSAEDIRLQAQVKVSHSAKANLGLGRKQVPSYFTEGDFRPLGADVERVMGVPLLASPDEARHSAAMVTAPQRAKWMKVAAKRLSKLSRRSLEEEAAVLFVLNDDALKRLAEGK